MIRPGKATDRQERQVPQTFPPLHLRTYGAVDDRTAPAVVGVHGWVADGTVFAELARQLGGRWAVYAPDLPGLGETPRVLPPTLDAILDRLEATVSGILPRHDAPPVLVGSCSGAGLLQTLVLGRALPDCRLVLLEPLVSVPPSLSLFLRPVLGAIAYHATFSNRVGRAITDWMLATRGGGREAVSHTFARASPGVPRDYLRVFATLPPAQEFRALDAEIDVVYGDATLQDVLDSVELWRRVWPNARFHAIAGAGHLLLRDRPDRVADVVTRGAS